MDQSLIMATLGLNPNPILLQLKVEIDTAANMFKCSDWKISNYTTGAITKTTHFRWLGWKLYFYLDFKIKFTVALFDRALKGKTKQIRLY